MARSSLNVDECAICFERYTTDGTEVGVHRGAALTACGHMFGYECIGRWVVAERNCPMCKKHATPPDVLLLYSAGSAEKKLSDAELEYAKAEKEARRIAVETQLREDVKRMQEEFKLAALENNRFLEGLLAETWR